MMIGSIKDFYEQAGTTVAALEVILTPDLQEALQVDHISYKCGSRESFERIRNLFEAVGANFWNAHISDRSIAYIFLPKPIKTSLGKITFLELSDQKPDNLQQEGFDHIEVYSDSEPFWTPKQVIKVLSELGLGEVKYSARPHHPTYDLVIDEAGLELRLEREPLINSIIEEIRQISGSNV